MLYFAISFLVLVANVKAGIIYLPSDKTYDYVIVGGGTAGCVLANRLTESGEYQVLLIEAGLNDLHNVFASTPGLNVVLWNEPTSWIYYYEPLPYANALKNNQARGSGGKMLGGGSSTNGLDFVRGSRYDFDLWAEVAGDDDWNYQSVLPYFQRLETFGDFTYEQSDYRGEAGPLQVRFETDRMPITDRIVNGFIEAGVEFNEDYNGEKMVGIAYVQGAVDKNHRRSSTSSAYLQPIVNTRANLDVITSALVTKVVFDGTTATSVLVQKRGQEFEIQATNEIILSAGAIATPKLLMLSGVGPKDHLDDLGIDLVADLPVGKNLQDHVNFPFPIATNVSESRPSFTDLRGNLPYIVQELAYFTDGSGFLGRTNIESQVFERVRDNDDPDDWPDLQIMLSPLAQGGDILFTINYDPAVAEEVIPIRFHYDGFNCFVQNSRPRQRGEVRLRSSDYNDSPILDSGNAVELEEDIEVFTKGINLCLDAAATNPLQQVGAAFPDRAALSYCSQHEFRSDDYWACLVRAAPITIQHHVGTCKMGKLEDDDTVVGSDLRVKGLDNLRVIDGSIMPTITSGNTYAPIIMIGEKGADLVLDKPVLAPQNL